MHAGRYFLICLISFVLCLSSFTRSGATFLSQIYVLQDTSTYELQALELSSRREYDSALVYFLKAKSSYDSLESPTAFYRSVVLAADTYLILRRIKEGIAFLKSYETAITKVSINDSLRYEYVHQLGKAYYYNEDDFLALARALEYADYLEKQPSRQKELVAAYRMLTVEYLNTGLFIQGLEYAGKYRQKAKEFEGEKSYPVADACNFQGMISRYIGETNHSILYYTQAIEIANELQKENPDIPVSILVGNIGLVYLDDLKQYEKAYTYFQRALRMEIKQFGHEGRDLARKYGKLAAYHRAVKNYDSAHYYSGLSLELRKKNKERIESIYAETIFDGLIYLDENMPDKALELFNKAYKVRFAEKGDQPQEHWAVFHHMAKAYFKKENYDSALYYYHASLLSYLPDKKSKMLEAPGFVDGVGERLVITKILKEKGDVLKKMSQTPSDKYAKAALNHYAKALEWMNEIRASYVDGESKSYISENNLLLIDEVVRLASQLYHRTNNKAWLELVQTTMEGNRSVALKEALVINTIRSDASNSGLQEKEEVLRSEISFLNGKLFTLHSPDQKGDSLKLAQSLIEAKNELRDLRQESVRNRPSELTLKEVQDQILKPNEVYMSFILGERYLHQLLVTADTVSIRSLDTIKSLSEKVQKIRMALKMNNAEIFNQLAFELYHDLITPITDLPDPDKYDKLIMITDGFLNDLPFDLLRSQLPKSTDKFDNAHYLIQDFTINRILVTATLKQEKSSEVSPQGFLAFTPYFSDKRIASLSRGEENELNNLPFAREESNALVDLYQGVGFYGSGATETQFKNRCENASVIHIATHAIVDADKPDQSRLILEADSLNDGTLYAYELYGLKMNSELVTLSACNTGIGQYRTGEGNMSLARGFYYAGNKSVVMSLWLVEDQSTSQLMQSFYHQLKKGGPKDEALRKAKLEFLEQADNLHRNPYYWAGFDLIGDASPLQGTGHRPWLIYGLTGVLLLLVVGVMVFRAIT